jgi:hypothetical protein
MLVTPTSYPGGPQGVTARLERRDLWPLVRRFSRGNWFAVAVLALLGAFFFSLYNGRNAYGVLGLICGVFAVFFAMNPLVVASNLLMDVFYFDEQWAASYRPHRHSAVDLTQVTSITTSSGRWEFNRGSRWGIMVPEELVLLEPVRTLVSRALKEAARTHNIKMSDRTRHLLVDAISDDAQNSRMLVVSIAKPPLRAWDGVRKRRWWNRPSSNV